MRNLIHAVIDILSGQGAAGIALLLGPVISIGSLILHAYALHDMGLPIEIWVSIGLLIFFLGVVGVLYKSNHSPKEQFDERLLRNHSPPATPRYQLLQRYKTRQIWCRRMYF
jgi:hypothetical protein